MSLLEKMAVFQQMTEFEQGRIIGLPEEGISKCVQRKSKRLIQVWKQWTDAERKTRKYGTTWWTRCAMISTWFIWQCRPLDSPKHIDQMLHVLHCLLCQFLDVCCKVDRVQYLFYTQFDPAKHYNDCVCSCIINIATAVQIKNSCLFSVISLLICVSTIVALILDAKLVYAYFRGECSNVIDAEHLVM